VGLFLAVIACTDTALLHFTVLKLYIYVKRNVPIRISVQLDVTICRFIL
jgi:hypothetical protein